MTLKLSPQAVKLLKQLTESGLYGSTPEGTAQILLKERLRQILATKTP